jgi:hypothetical protein
MRLLAAGVEIIIHCTSTTQPSAIALILIYSPSTPPPGPGLPSGPPSAAILNLAHSPKNPTVSVAAR